VEFRKLLTRFVDDIIDLNLDSHMYLLHCTSSVRIKPTDEMEGKKRFLDSNTIRQDCNLKIDTFHKTPTDMSIHYTSNHLIKH
jgi:hypothetical protein